jgi:hypothetical protein
MGNNITKLAIHLATLKAIPPGGGLASGIQWLTDNERRNTDLKAAFEEAKSYIDAIKSAPGGEAMGDDEAIAGEILRQIEERKQSHKASEGGEG